MDYPRSGRRLPRSRCDAFEPLWTDAAEMGVATVSVIEDLNIVEDIGSGEVSGLVDALSKMLLLQAKEE